MADARASDAARRREGPRRHAGDAARHDRRHRSRSRDVRSTQAADSRPSSRSVTALRRLSPRRAARRAAAAAPVSARNARDDDGEPRRDWSGARDRVSGRLVGYALGSALENHDEEGSASDPHAGEGNTFYVQALATLPAVQNQAELENALLDAVRERAIAARFELPLHADRRARGGRARSGCAARPFSTASRTTCAAAARMCTFRRICARRRSQTNRPSCLTRT